MSAELSQHDTPPSNGCVHPDCSPLWRSAVSGLWYRKTGAAGTINATKCERCGDMLERDEEETGLHWIHRVAEWWQTHHEANTDYPEHLSGYYPQKQKP